MVFFFENGRLGNQLFQLSGLKRHYQTEKLVLIGFDSLFNLIEEEEQCLRLPGVLRIKVVENLILNLFEVFSKLRIIASSWEDFNVIYKRSGLLNNIVYFSSGFFQNDKATINLKIKKELLDKANEFIDHLELSENTKVFIHVRRGDYINWPSSQYPAVLSNDWYEKAVKYFSENFANCFFIVFTDDVPYCQDFINARKNFVIAGQDQFMDLSIMSRCDHGILSASSFSLGAAYFVKQNNEASVFVAPKYWFGHREKRWLPLNFIIDWILYI